jgi:hypothetical protein
VKFARFLLRIGLLSLAAAAIVWLTAIYGGPVKVRPIPDWQRERRHRPRAPEFSQFPELIGYVLLVVFFAGIGRIALRLRLSPASRNEGQPISLGLSARGQLPDLTEPGA